MADVKGQSPQKEEEKKSKEAKETAATVSMSQLFDTINMLKRGASPEAAQQTEKLWAAAGLFAVDSMMLDLSYTIAPFNLTNLVDNLARFARKHRNFEESSAEWTESEILKVAKAIVLESIMVGGDALFKLYALATPENEFEALPDADQYRGICRKWKEAIEAADRTGINVAIVTCDLLELTQAFLVTHIGLPQKFVNERLVIKVGEPNGDRAALVAAAAQEISRRTGISVNKAKTLLLDDNDVNIRQTLAAGYQARPVVYRSDDQFETMAMVERHNIRAQAEVKAEAKGAEVATYGAGYAERVLAVSSHADRIRELYAAEFSEMQQKLGHSYLNLPLKAAAKDTPAAVSQSAAPVLLSPQPFFAAPSFGGPSFPPPVKRAGSGDEESFKKITVSTAPAMKKT